MASEEERGVIVMSEETTENLTSDDKLDLLLREVRDLKQRIVALEAKSYDTRPIWEQALKEIMETRLETQEGFGLTNTRLEKIEKEMRLTNRKFEVFTNEFLELRARQRDLEDRQDKMEPPH